MLNKFLKYTTLFIISASVVSLSYAKPSIRALTSKKKAREVNIVANNDRDDFSTNEHTVGFGIGQTVLLGHFADNADDKITGEIFYSYSASHSFDMLVNLHYSKHEFGTHKVEIPGMSVGLKGKAFQFDKFSPFVIAGFGFYRPVIDNSRRKITFGYHFGGGADLRLNRHLVLGILGHFHNPFDVKQVDKEAIEGSYLKMLLTLGYIF